MARRLTTIALALLVLAGLSTGGASAQKGGAPVAVLLGGQGVVSPDGDTRYVALSTGRQTIVSSIQVGSGKVLRWRNMQGNFGVPMISIDGATEGVSRDGRTLVLATQPSGTVTHFALLETKTLKLRRIELQGVWSYDAISPDGSLLYLIQYAGLGSTSPSYRVRAYDTRARRLLSKPVVDPKNGERLMRGWSVTRKSTSDGRWAYTLYAREGGTPFVHALDTMTKRALCLDVPLRFKQSRQMTLRLRLRADRMLDVREGDRTVATIDMRRFVVHKH